jgi:hypothetical protein
MQGVVDVTVTAISTQKQIKAAGSATITSRKRAFFSLRHAPVGAPPGGTAAYGGCEARNGAYLAALPRTAP